MPDNVEDFFDKLRRERLATVPKGPPSALVQKEAISFDEEEKKLKMSDISQIHPIGGGWQNGRQ